jgi:hypothetical protein
VPKDKKTTSMATAVMLLSGLWLGTCADAQAEATTAPKQGGYSQTQGPPARDKSPMTTDEQSKLKKDLINARDRQTSHIKTKEGATRPKPTKP